MTQHYKLKLGSFLIASTLSTMTYASGFAIIEQSVTGLGRAFAGSAAVAEDASTIFFNPAGLTNLTHTELDVGLNYIAPQSEFRDSGSRSPFGVPLTGGDGGDAGNNALVPNIYYSRAINERAVFGLGINAPFGLVTEYNDAWQGRYHAVKSDLKTININPSLAFKATDKLSVGFGIDLQKIELTLTQMADLGALGGSSTSQKYDGKVNIEVDDWSWGYNLGLTYQIQEATRLGLAYRSKISHMLEGYGTLHASTGVLAADGNISGGVDLPESLSFAIHHQINQQWAIMGDASWTRWSRFKELSINSEGTLPSSVKQENWSNSMRYGLGFTYTHSDTWTFRGGVAFDQTPVANPYRTPRIPDQDRKWLAIGASYKYSANITVDTGYTHIFVNDPTINDTDNSGYTIKGDYEASVDILGIQMRWLFL